MQLLADNQSKESFISLSDTAAGGVSISWQAGAQMELMVCLAEISAGSGNRDEDWFQGLVWR